MRTADGVGEYELELKLVKIFYMATTRTTFKQLVPNARWLWTLLVLLGGLLTPANAQTKDVITFSGGYVDEKDPTIYVIDVKPENLIGPNEEEYDYNHKARVTFQRPLGATATREASITVMESIGWSEEITVTFAPGETEKTVDLVMQTFPHGESNGNSPVPFVVLRTNHADTDYKMLLLNIPNEINGGVPQCTYDSQLGVLKDLSYNMSNDIYCQRWGNQLVFSMYLQDTYVEVSEDCRVVLQTRYTDHTGLPTDADDYVLSKTREVVLTPINVGAVSNQILYVYHPRDDEYLYSYKNEDKGIDNAYPDAAAYKGIFYRIVEAGPFKLANPAEGAIKTFFLSRADLGDGFTYMVNADSKKFVPEFSNISINKTSFKSGETMVITAKMDNWQVVKRARQSTFMMGFGVSFDNGKTTEPRRFSFDESTGILTCYATAPTVTESTTINVDFGPVADAPIYDEEGEYTGYYSDQVVTGSEGMFSVSVLPEPAPAVPATQIDFVEMPADGSDIAISGSAFDLLKFPLVISSIPANATDAGTVVYTVANPEGTDATIEYTEQGEPMLNTGQYEGTIIVTATLNSGVSTSRTYYLKKMSSYTSSHTNTFLAGTTFPKFQFELNRIAQLNGGWEEWTQAEPVTVNYTHANGMQWTEQYNFDQLTYHSQYYQGTEIHWVRNYDLPFVFSEEHPNATIDQIGKPLVTAEIVVKLQNAEGHRMTAKATATLIAQLKELSFSDYSSTTAYYNDVHPVTLSSEVMYLPTKGFTVGYEIPELGLSETYNSQSGDAVPDWLEVQEEGIYSTARITVTPSLGGSTTHLSLYTLAQSSYDPDAAMQRYLTSSTDLTFIEPEGHMVYRVNGQDVTGDLTFSNVDAVNNIISTIQSSGFSHDDLFGTLQATRAFFTIYDDIFEGANVTLTCDGEPIQSLTHYKGCFTFMPPADGHTYKIDVYYPGYGKHYENTFANHDLRNIYQLQTVGSQTSYSSLSGITHTWYYMPGIYDVSYESNGKTYTTTCDDSRNITAFIYTDNPGTFNVHYENSNIRITDRDMFAPMEYTIKPELMKERDALFSYQDAMEADANYLNAFKRLYSDQWTSYGSSVTLDWDQMASNHTIVTVVNSQGDPITNATLNYACVDKAMALQGSAGTAGYDASTKSYQISTDPHQYAQLIEVVADGYQPVLTTMYLWNYDYYCEENKGKPRRHTIVLHQSGEQLKNLSFETLERKGNVKNDKMDAERVVIDLLTTDKSDVLNYSETADYETAVKHLDDPKFGKDGWTGTKYVHLTGYMPYQDNLDLKLTNSDGSVTLRPEIHDYNKQMFTTFSQSYCQFDFDLAGKIAENTTVQPLLMNGTQTLAELPSLHNQTIDLMALSEENNVSLPCNAADLTKVDNDLNNNGVDMKDMGKAFDKFNFQMPPILPFTVNIERNGDYFLVRAVCERNFIPGGKVMDALNKLDDIKYFDEQYQACVDAVNSAKPMNDDFFNDIPRFPSAFCGIKGFLSGIGYINPQTKKLEINFYDGGLTFEASASARANVSFFIGGFGMSVDAKLATTMALVNRAAALGQVGSLPKIDFVIDNQCRLKICAWAYGGIDIWIAKATAGVRGGGCVDLQTRTCIPTYGEAHHSGTRTTVRAAMEAYAEVRFLWWKKKKSWKIFDAQKNYLSPNNAGNPLHPDYEEGLFTSFSRQNVNKSYKKLKKKVIADLGTPIISNVSGMARPTYMLGGNSLLFNNLKTPADYNDDCLQLFDGSSKSDLVDTGVDAPMYDFAATRYRTTEMVAFEQVNSSIDKDKLEALDESGQEQSVTENTSIYASINYDDGHGWQTSRVSQLKQGVACLTPAVAIDKGNAWHCAAIWQQGKVKFNDEGERYIDGSLMLSRNQGWGGWSEPIEIMRLNQRSVPVDYQICMNDGEVLVMMTLKQDVNNNNKQPTVVFLNVDTDDKVHMRYTMMEGSKPQMVNVKGTNLVAFLQQKGDSGNDQPSGRDITISTVNMKGEPTGEVSGSLGLDRQMVNDFRLIADDDAKTIDDVALLWTQSDQEGTTDEQTGTTTFTIKNSIYTSKLNSYNNALYLTKPFAVATIPDDVKLVSMDGYLDGLDMKVAFCVANDDEGAAVLEKNVTFDDGFESTLWFNGFKNNAFEIEVEVVNTGLSPINAVEIVMANVSTSTYNVTLLPQQSMRFPVHYPEELFGYLGRFDIDVHALIQPSASNSAKVRRSLAKRPRRISQNASLTAEIPVDMALKVLSKHIDDDGRTTIVAEVNNASKTALKSGTKCKVGLYAAPLATEAVSNEVTISYEDLYDASESQNKVKIVKLTTDAPDHSQVLFLRTTPMNGSDILTDERPSNNILPVTVKGKYDEQTTSLEEVKKPTIDVETESWFTIDGLKLQKRPTTKGVYIRNNEKVVIK